MHIPAEHFEPCKPEHLRSGAIQKGAAALQVDTVKTFVSRFEERLERNQIGGSVWHTSGSYGRIGQQRLDFGEQAGEFHGFCVVIVATRIEGPLAVTRHGVGG